MARTGGRTPQQKQAHRSGVHAEKMAVLFLRAKGYRILATRYRTPVGEIDIVARHGATLVFVEVKRRQGLEDALRSLTPHQQTRIVRAAYAWLGEHELSLGTDCRFDMIVFSAYLVPHHMKNAFTADGM